VFRGEASIVDAKAPEFITFWVKGGRVRAGMNANIWDVNDDVKALVHAGHVAKQVDLEKLPIGGSARSDLLNVAVLAI
jgi:hypothetical protein